MHSLSFDFHHEYSKADVAIWLDVSIGTVAPSVQFRAKIDTGADFCIFQRQYGELIGLDIESGLPKRFETATGSFDTYGHAILIEACSVRLETTAYFAKDLTFSKNVLGLIGWIDRLRLGLEHHSCALYLNRL